MLRLLLGHDQVVFKDSCLLIQEVIWTGFTVLHIEVMDSHGNNCYAPNLIMLTKSEDCICKAYHRLVIAGDLPY